MQLCLLPYAQIDKIMKYYFKIFFFIIIAQLFAGVLVCQAEYDYIDISNPFLRKIPIAIPFFKSIGDGPEVAKASVAKASVDGSDLLSETLEFTGYFKILDREAFLADSQSSIIIPKINFRNWTFIKAELLITGSILIKNNVVEMELRLFDTFKERLLIGKRYKGWKKDQRKIIRRFCDEVVYHLTGKHGIFSTKLAFVSNSTGNKEIYICDFDGHDPKRFTHNKTITLFPAWSSSGKQLAYTSFIRGKPDLFIKNINKKRGFRLVKKGIQIAPAWVPGKYMLSATLSFSGDQEIYLLTGEGKVINRLTKSRGIDVDATWSPDGKKMAFVSKRSGTPQIYIKEIASGRVSRLTYDGRYNTQPSWSPQGDKIVYSAMSGTQINIIVIDIKSGKLLKLTDAQGDNESPTWSPDSSLIAFSSTREGQSKIYVMTMYGTEQRRLFTMAGEQTDPAWSPGFANK